jgi:hypothetical protein
LFATFIDRHSREDAAEAGERRTDFDAARTDLELAYGRLMPTGSFLDGGDCSPDLPVDFEIAKQQDAVG